MKRYSKLIPQGTRDLLFEECDDRRNVESILSALFKEYNYRKVMTPTVEFFDVFSENDLGIEAEEMYKLSDSLGRTTVLRPDNTVLNLSVMEVLTLILKLFQWLMKL